MCCAWTSLLYFSHLRDAKRGRLRNFTLEISGRYPSGQRGQTVNLLPSASKVRILACPPQQAMRTAVVSVEPGHDGSAASTLNITLEIKAGVAQR
jgi:hypothetical protein